MSTAPAPTLDVSATRPVPFGRTFVAEFRKSYDTRAGMWLLISIAIIVTIVEVFMLIVSAVNDSTAIYFDTFAFVPGAVTSLLLPVLAIMLVTSEWTQRSAMFTFVMEPRRFRVILAKWLVGLCWALVTLVVMLVVGAVMTVLSSILSPDATHWTGSSGAPNFLGFVVLQLLTMSTGFAFAALLLNTPAAIVVFFLYWYLFPGILAAIGLISEPLRKLMEWVNFQQAAAPLVDGGMSGEDWAKLIVSTLVCIVLPLGLGLWRIMRAEVK